MKENVIAIVPAAGLGRRFSHSHRKVFAHIDGIPVLVYTLKRLQEIKSVTEIIPVLGEGDIGKGLKLFKAHRLKKVKRVVAGGRERQDSVFNALQIIKKDALILIHDGVRPLISTDLVERLLHELRGVSGVIPGLPVRDTLKEANKRGIVLSTTNREKLWAVQTPQLFSYRVIRKAYDKAYKDDFYATDDAALVERIGGKIKIIAGSPFNIKITTPEDLQMVKSVLQHRTLKQIL